MQVNTGDSFKSTKSMDFTHLQLVFVVSEEKIQKDYSLRNMTSQHYTIFVWQENVLISTPSNG